MHEITNHRQCCKPSPQLIEELNRHLEGWKNYVDFGYPAVAFGEINSYIRYRLTQHLRRRSQRPFRPPEESATTNRSSVLGWCVYKAGSHAIACASLRQYVFRRAGCREIRLSGSTRGEWVAPQGVALSPTLPPLRAIALFRRIGPFWSVHWHLEGVTECGSCWGNHVSHEKIC